MSDATIIVVVTTICGCIISCVTIWQRTRPGALYTEVLALRDKIETMHNTITSQNQTISRQDEHFRGGDDTHKFTQAERDRAAGTKIK